VQPQLANEKFSRLYYHGQHISKSQEEDSSLAATVQVANLKIVLGIPIWTLEGETPRGAGRGCCRVAMSKRYPGWRARTVLF